MRKIREFFKKLEESLIWQPLRGGNGVTQMNELAAYWLLVTFIPILLLRAVFLYFWEVDFYPIILAQTHLAVIAAIAGIIVYKQTHMDK